MNWLMLGTGLTAKSVQNYLPDVAVQMVEPDAIIANGTADAAVRQADQIIISPGIAPSHPIHRVVQQHGKKIMTDLDLLLTNKCRPIAAITGTNGKTTVTKLVQYILQFNGYSAKIGGNIGIAMLEFLQGESVDYWLLELSSFQLYYSQSPTIQVSCILNISPDHLNWHQGFEQYCESKQKIHHNATICVANGTQPLTQPNDRIFLDFTNANTADNIFSGYDLLPSLSINFAAAYTTACALTKADLIVPPLADVTKNLEHWSQYRANIEQLNKHCWIAHASKATNIDAAQSVLDWLFSYWNQQQIDLASLTILIGGDNKGIDLSAFIIATQKQLEQHYPEVHKQVIVYGAAHATCDTVHSVEKTPSLAAAVNSIDACNLEDSSQAEGQSKSQYWVVLLPACSSLDEFSSYAERGDVFADLMTARVAAA